jgi:hypothetical protein
MSDLTLEHILDDLLSRLGLLVKKHDEGKCLSIAEENEMRSILETLEDIGYNDNKGEIL